MKKNSKSKSSSGPKVDPYLEGLMSKLLERLVSLEKKIDSLIAQPRSSQNAEAKPPAHRDRMLYEAICADCHKVCEVPFKPSEARPVYCKECFAKRKSGGSGPAYPVLTPVAMPNKAFLKSPLASASAPSVAAPKKPGKSQPSKKAKKKK